MRSSLNNAQQKNGSKIANIVVTTGQGFDGYSITHYSGPWPVI